MKVVLAVALALTLQAPSPARFDSSRAWEHLRQLVALGPRPAGSPAIEESRSYIKQQLARASVPVREQAWDDQTPAGPVRMVNLAATIAGGSSDRLVIAGHYDTKRIREFRFVGANDGGSSTAFLLELARVLKGRRNPMTIELLFLDGEEAVVEWQGNDRTYGSRHYVSAARRDGSLATLKALVLVDMIADRDLRIKKDDNSTEWLTEVIWQAARRQKLSAHFSDERTQIEDDHLPFLQARVPAVDIIDLEYPAWHTAGDTLDAVSARSMQVVADTLLAALPDIEARLLASDH
ncbi:MAG: M28 family peptidase [Luteitalea sp.]|nr:M28 family peptidase [Luteitalea sp.]